MSDLVTLKIDGIEVSVPAGTMIIEAANKIGREIPVFCYHSKLSTVGVCRVCLVKVGTPGFDRATRQPILDVAGNPVIRFFPKPMPACSTPVSAGMEVITESKESLADRQAILEFLLTSHPLDCPVCDKGGECPLQDLTYAHGRGESRFEYQRKHTSPKKIPLGDLIVLDTERCIICTRCIRFQDEIAGDHVLAIENRGRDAKVVSYTEPKFDSKYSGNTTDICPVGALTSRDFRFKDMNKPGVRIWELTNVPSISNYCNMGSNLVLGTHVGEIRRVMPRQNELVNEIWLTNKTRFGHHFHSSSHRLTAPLIKENGKFKQATWEDALSLIATKFHEAGEHIGGIAGPHLSNEDLYLFQKLFREVLNSNNIDHRICLNSAIDDDLAYEIGVGIGTDIGQLAENSAIFLLGSDLDEEASMLYLRVRGAVRRGCHLINANGRYTKLDTVANTKLRYNYGSAVHLVLGMTATILDEGLEDKNFVYARLEGIDKLKTKLQAYTPEKVADITGIDADIIRQAARDFAKAENGIILYGAEAGNDTALHASIRNLALITGHVGKKDNGVTAILPHCNSRGAADLGVIPHRLPGYHPVADEIGMSAKEMLQPNHGLQAMYIVAADIVGEVVTCKSAIETTDFVVVQDLFMTETAKLADVVLPAKAIAERDGSYTNLERRVQVYDPAILSPTPTCWADWHIITAIAGRLGAEWTHASADGVMQEITEQVSLYKHMSFENLTKPISLERKRQHYIYSGMSFTADVREGVQWATRAENQASFFELKFIEPENDMPQSDIILVAPRVAYDGGMLISQAEILANLIQQPKATLSPSVAQRLSLSKGDTVQLTSSVGSVALPIAIDGKLPDNVVLTPRNLAGSVAEQLLDGHNIFIGVKIVH
ncbi:MAG: NADH dehydrogenase (quinone) subunit G [Anaerolineaceae bacterium 4572_78]|nr:MAG: NADH dehydrogenase (quinone) subunit G [Anaerolineaceae bacterium 4572_78]